MRFAWPAFLTFALALLATPATAQERKPGCLPDMSEAPARIMKAALSEGEMKLTFVGHATFLIESPAGVKIETDYNDYVRAPVTPDIATMNRAHDTHYSNNPEPGIGQILRGWTPDGSPAHHDVTLQDIRIRNVVTNIRQWGTDRTIYNGNSIFIVEQDDFCIAHLGHLHHELEPEHYRALGRIDVLLMPVDGNYTLSQESMLEVAKHVQAKIMIPMHYFGSYTLDRFLELASKDFRIERRTSPVITVSKATLPDKPTIVVLPGR